MAATSVKALACALIVLGACDAAPEARRARVAREPVPGEVGDAAPSEEIAPDVVETPPDAADDTSLPPDTADTAVADTTTEADTVVPDTSDTSDTTVEPDTVAPSGTPADPIAVTRFPFVVADDTTLSPSDALDRYDCAAATDESGPERVYRFEVTAAGTFIAEVEEADGVDVDVHLLAADPAQAVGASVACVARANTLLEVEVGPGRYWLVVDSYVAAAGEKPGAYRLALEHVVLDAWQVTPIAPGVVWRQKVYANLAGGRQTVNSLDVDLAEPSVSVRPHLGDGCLRPSRAAPAEGAVAAVNAGFFDTGPGTCPPLDLVKIEGELLSTNHLNGAPQRSFGVDAEGAPLIAWVAANSDWPEAWSAIGSYPSLVTDGVIAIEPDKDTNFFVGRHPRTAIGLTASGHLLLVTVDGRTSAGLGMTLAQLAQHLVDLGAEQAMNLDGGGSTAMWVAGQSLNGIVSFPSDGGDTHHQGERSVSDLLLVFSP